MYLKWLNTDHLYLTSGGVLQIGGLSGAVLAGYTSTAQCNNNHGVLHGTVPKDPASVAGDPFSITALADKLSSHKVGRASSHKGASSAQKTHKKRKFHIDMLFDDEDEEDNNNNSAAKAATKLRTMAKKLGLPRSALYTVAPEVRLSSYVLQKILDSFDELKVPWSWYFIMALFLHRP